MIREAVDLPAKIRQLEVRRFECGDISCPVARRDTERGHTGIGIDCEWSTDRRGECGEIAAAALRVRNQGAAVAHWDADLVLAQTFGLQLPAKRLLERIRATQDATLTNLPCDRQLSAVVEEANGFTPARYRWSSLALCLGPHPTRGSESS